MTRIEKIFDGVYRIDNKLATENSVPGFTVYGEKIIRIEGKEYRFWDPYRSKLAAAINKGLKELPLSVNSKVLYLGAASGTTASHVSDIVSNGIIYCVEFSPRVMRDLIPVCEKKRNMIPILEDARKPYKYRQYIEGKVDCIYEDVAQPDQVRILLMNSELFLREDGYAMIAIKSQSIDVTKKPTEIYNEALKELKTCFDVIQTLDLEPFEKDHLFILLKRKQIKNKK